MREALHDATAYERGEAVNLRVTRVPPRPRQISAREIRRIRRALNASQPLFASYLNVSPNAIRSWEHGARRPALKLLTIAKKNPARFCWLRDPEDAIRIRAHYLLLEDFEFPNSQILHRGSERNISCVSAVGQLKGRPDLLR
jgi:putative transcriptional regulator